MKLSNQVVDIRAHLKVLYYCFQFSGFSTFSFNRSTGRFEYSLIRRIISRILLEFIRFNCASMVLQCTLAIEFGPKKWKSIEAQEGFLTHAVMESAYISTLVIATNYINLGKMLVPALNELVGISKAITKITKDSTIFLSATFQGYLLLKVVFCTSHSVMQMVLLMGLFYLSPSAVILAVLMNFGYLYYQFILICFYMKMNQLLKFGLRHSNKPGMTKDVKKLLKISFRIHRLKRQLNKFFIALFTTTYLGLFADINNTYDSVKEVIYSNGNFKGRVNITVSIVFWSIKNIPLPISTSTDIYLMARLSDALIDLERTFEQRVLLLVSKKKLKLTRELDWQVDQCMCQRKIYDLRSEGKQALKFDQLFFFDFMVNVVFVYVISFLQFYESERVSQLYSSNFIK